MQRRSAAISASLAKIRITRVQPEQKVEWEAAEASGSIVIKPSGWGTKVKLTVTRELSEAEAGGDFDETPRADEPPTTDDGHAAEEEPAAIEPAAEQRAAIAEARDPRVPAEIAVDAVAAAEPLTTVSTIPEVVEDEVGTSEIGEPSDGPPDRLEGSLGASAEQDDSRHEPEPQRRRGFFARLFGRRRAAHAAEHSGIDFQATSSAPMDDVEDAAEGELQVDDYDELEGNAPETTGEDTSNAALAADRDVAIEFEAELDTEPSAKPEVGKDSDTTETPRADGVSEDPSPIATAASLATELEQAEGAAAEQITAVLTGVLDRLGAAHHRPFSRA